jgi:hypothetical protein
MNTQTEALITRHETTPFDQYDVRLPSADVACIIHPPLTLLTVDAMEVLIKYCMNSFPQVDQLIRIQISFYFLCVSYWSIGSETKSNWLI